MIESRIVSATGFAVPARKVGSIKATMRFIKRHAFFAALKYRSVYARAVYTIRRIVGHTGAADGTPPPL
jgi:hypothetical protein